MVMRARSKGKPTDGPSPSHPQENFVEHRNFLIRSLQRNDVDIAALVELNRSLKAAKATILESCGESILLDLGIGRLTLVNDELHEDTKSSNSNSKTKDKDDNSNDSPTHHLTPVQKATCVDFLLRMKLRRKLCNRLARRLNRVAQAMDGEDVAPPPPPRYGELRLNMDPSAVEAKAEHWNRLEEAKKAIREAKLEEQRQQQLRQHQQQLLQRQNAPLAVEPIQENEQTDLEGTIKEEKEVEGETEQPEIPSSDIPQEADGAAAVAATATTKEEEATPMDVEKPVEPAQPPRAPEAITSTSSSAATPIPMESFENPDHASALAHHYDVIKEYDTAYEKVWDPATNRFKYVIETEAAAEPEYTQIKQGIGGAARAMSIQEREAEHKRWQTAVLSRIPAQPTFEDLGLKNRVFCYEARKRRCLELEREEQEDGSDEDADVEGEKESKKLKTGEDVDEKDANKDGDDDKDASTEDGTDKETKAEDDGDKEEKSEDDKDDEDEVEAKSDGEDAKEEKQDEEIAAKEDSNDDMDIDDEKAEEEAPEKKDAGTDIKKDAEKNSEKEDDDSSDMFDDESSKDEEKDDTMKKSDGDDESSDMFEADEEEDDEEEEEKKKIDQKPKPDPTATSEQSKSEVKGKGAPAEEKKEEPEEEKKPIKPMNLAAVPSFHDQDMARIRMIHGDLIATSMMEHARKRLTEVTRDYNNAFRASNELFDQRHRLQQNLNFFIAKSRNDLLKANNDYTLEVAIAKQRWMKQKHEYDVKRAQGAMPSNWGHKPFGTSLLQTHIQRAQDLRALIGTCLADVVDGSIMIAEGKVQNKKFGDFVPPPNPTVNKQTGETLAAQHLQMENQLKMQMNGITTKFNASEEERNRIWKKMMKAKADLELPQQQYSARRGRIDYTKMPLPPLRNSSQQTMPRELDYARAALATYTPPPRAAGPSPLDTGTSDSKYSAARVRERIGNDGTVAPVTEPKKTKEGLYQRPAGRTRKGMQWDAIRGIWVPEGSQ